MLKEAPCSDAELAWPGCDFINKNGEVQIAGVGLEPGDLDPAEWTRGYGCVIGVADSSEYGILSALRVYQEQIRIHLPDRDEMILLNTWGDRGQDTRIREAFALAELEVAARLGITHFQLDDGLAGRPILQLGVHGGSLENIWSRFDCCPPHPNGSRTGSFRWSSEQHAGHRAVPVVQPQQG